MTDFDQAERHAYVAGDTTLAELFAIASEHDAIDLEKIAKAEYDRGYADGERAASDQNLLLDVERLTKDVKQEKKARAELFEAFTHFLEWLQTDDAKKIAARTHRVQALKSYLYKWR